MSAKPWAAEAVAFNSLIFLLEFSLGSNNLIRGLVQFV